MAKTTETTYGRLASYDIEPGMGPFGILARVDARRDDIKRLAVAYYRLRLDALGMQVENPWPLYYPGMPAYDKAHKLIECDL